MMLKSLIIISTILLFSGCCTPKIEYREKTKEVQVPVECKVPEVKCELKEGANLVERFSELLTCIELHKEANKVCSGKSVK